MLLHATIVLVVLAGMCIALLGMNLQTARSRTQVRNEQRAFYAAEAGLSDAFARVRANPDLLPADAGETTWIGNAEAPLPLGPASYWVEVSVLDERSYSLAATGVDDHDTERLELVLAEIPDSIFQYAAFGADSVVLDSNAFIDSYDSLLGTYDSQVQGGNEYARERGDVGSNGDIRLRSNTEIHGDVRPGPGHILNDSAPNITISGSTEPLEEEVEFPPIDVPVVASAGTIDGSSDIVLGPGDIHYDSILMGGGSKLTVRGPARLIVDDFHMRSNTELIFDATDGQIDVFGTGNFVLESNSTVTTLSDTALDVTLLLSGNNMTDSDQVELGSNSQFVGAIYAPNAEFSLASNFDIFGSIMCGRLHLSSFGEIHFDEALLYDGFGASGELETALWRVLPKE